MQVEPNKLYKTGTFYVIPLKMVSTKSDNDAWQYIGIDPLRTEVDPHNTPVWLTLSWGSCLFDEYLQRKEQTILSVQEAESAIRLLFERGLAIK